MTERKPLLCPSDASSPIVFNKTEMLDKWPLVKWSLEEWSAKCRVMFPFRVHCIENETGDVQWENTAIDSFEASLADYIEWKTDSIRDPNKNLFGAYSNQDFWVYSSYNYLDQLLNEFNDNEILASINWAALGFEEARSDGKESSLWIGSKHAFTPCHRDTYGYNLVAQIKGRKLWVLFPPTDSDFLYPTRVPYEESSVFSAVNVPNPDLKAHPLFKHVHPYVVVLEPGDILYVPHGWWHFVQCLDDEGPSACISVNTWLPNKGVQEDIDHQQEAVVGFLATALIPTYEPEGQNWINDEADVMTPTKSMSLLQMMTNLCKPREELMPQTKAVSMSNLNKGTAIRPSSLSQLQTLLNWSSVNETTEAAQANNNCELTEKDIVNCILHPDVIKLIATKLRQT